jgi:hypothetical protein
MCGAGEACGLLGPTTDGVQLACVRTATTARFPSCRSATDCPTGLCHEGVCTEACFACEAGAECAEAEVDAGFGTVRLAVCQPRRAQPSLVLGPIQTSTAGTSEPIDFEVPPGLASLAIVLRSRAGDRVTLTRLEDPTGERLIDRRSADPDPNPMVAYIETASALVPNSRRFEARAGRWTMEVGSFEPRVFDRLEPRAGRVDTIEVIFEPMDEVGGALDLHIGLASSFGLTATTATTSGFVQDILRNIEDSLLVPADIGIGDLRFSVLDPEHDRVEDGDETRRMCATLSRPGPRGTSLSLFVVDDMNYTSGHAGGIPGPPGVFRSRASCVVIERLGSGARTGVLAAHELGHFLGLRHTTELDGTPDPIEDTPACESGTALNRCPDYRNLMFPRFPVDQTLRLTETQIEVIRGNPLLHEPSPQ